MQINLTFKTKEQWIYDELMKHSSPTAFIKDIILEYLNRGESK